MRKKDTVNYSIYNLFYSLIPREEFLNLKLQAVFDYKFNYRNETKNKELYLHMFYKKICINHRVVNCVTIDLSDIDLESLDINKFLKMEYGEFINYLIDLYKSKVSYLSNINIFVQQVMEF